MILSACKHEQGLEGKNIQLQSFLLFLFLEAQVSSFPILLSLLIFLIIVNVESSSLHRTRQLLRKKVQVYLYV